MKCNGSTGLGMCQGQSTTLFLCVPKYITTKYNTIHTAIIIYNASANQSALPLCLPESDRVPLCTCTEDNAGVLAFSLYLYSPICIQQKNNSPNHEQFHCILCNT